MTAELVPLEPIARERGGELVLPDRDQLVAKLSAIRGFQALVQTQLRQGLDFGVIPGTGNKPTLLKPGAEKITSLLGLRERYTFVDRVEDWERGFFSYTVCCELVLIHSGSVVSEGQGNCNSRESRYRYRWAWPNDLTKEERDYYRSVRGATRKINTRNGETEQFRVENDDPYSLVNTIVKMANKRAMVAATLSAGSLSEVFTQDLEDHVPDGDPSPAPIETRSRQQPPSQQGGSRRTGATSPPPPQPPAKPAAEAAPPAPAPAPEEPPQEAPRADAEGVLAPPAMWECSEPGCGNNVGEGTSAFKGNQWSGAQLWTVSMGAVQRPLCAFHWVEIAEYRGLDPLTGAQR